MRLLGSLDKSLFMEKESTILISQILGYIGGALVVSLNIPQLILIIKTKNVSNYSKETIILNIVIDIENREAN